MRILLLVVLMLIVTWLAVDLVDQALDHDTADAAPPAQQWGRTAPPYVIDRAATSTTVVARARTAPIAVGALQDMIRAGFARFGPAVAEQAVHVAGCESTGDPTGAHLDPEATNGAHAGLFQLSKTYHEERARRLGFTWQQMWDAWANITVAADLFAEKMRWAPTWSCAWAA